MNTTSQKNKTKTKKRGSGHFDRGRSDLDKLLKRMEPFLPSPPSIKKMGGEKWRDASIYEVFILRTK